MVGDIIGLHDASWRSNFGASFYVYGGSHGCVNTPEEAMALIWNLAEDGTPVLMHGANEWYEPPTATRARQRIPRGTTSKVTVPNGTRVLEPGSSRIEIQPDDVVPFALPKEAGQDEIPRQTPRTPQSRYPEPNCPRRARRGRSCQNMPIMTMPITTSAIMT